MNGIGIRGHIQCLKHEGSQDKKIVMIGIREGSQEGRHGTKRKYKEKSAAKKENCNSRGL